MKRLCLDSARCTACGLCIDKCPREALQKNVFHKPVLVKGLCTYCGLCTELCPVGALWLCGDGAGVLAPPIDELG